MIGEDGLTARERRAGERLDHERWEIAVALGLLPEHEVWRAATRDGAAG